MLKWLTFLVGFENIGIQEILGKIFIPIAWSLGVEWNDCELVAQVIGTKTIVNEFVAFEKLGAIKKAGTISLRSAAIATYAICGFANPSSMGILIGTLSAMAPEKRPTITSVAFRAFFSGCFVCFTTASIAGLLMTDEMINSSKMG
jgi:pyrimidine nucleoside transport protein